MLDFYLWHRISMLWLTCFIRATSEYLYHIWLSGSLTFTVDGKFATLLAIIMYCQHKVFGMSHQHLKKIKNKITQLCFSFDFWFTSDNCGIEETSCTSSYHEPLHRSSPTFTDVHFSHFFHLIKKKKAQFPQLVGHVSLILSLLHWSTNTKLLVCFDHISDGIRGHLTSSSTGCTESKLPFSEGYSQPTSTTLITLSATLRQHACVPPANMLSQAFGYAWLRPLVVWKSSPLTLSHPGK